MQVVVLHYNVNDTGGADSVTLTVDQIPPHTHTYIDQYVVINNGYRPWIVFRK